MNVLKPIPTVYGHHYEKFSELWSSHVESLRGFLGEAIEMVKMPQKDAVEVPVIYVKPDRIIDALRFARDELKYNFLADISCTDETPDDRRFHVFYNLFSHENLNRIRFKTMVREDEEVDTATVIWKGANWTEREVFDMFGVRFKNHPDLRRILMDERWEGHPLRKDYDIRNYQFYPIPMEPQEKLLK